MTINQPANNLPVPSAPYIPAWLKKMHLLNSYNALKQNNDPYWSKFKSFSDIDENSIGKLIAISAAENKKLNFAKNKSIVIARNVIQAVAYSFIALGSLSFITFGVLSFAAAVALPIALAAAALLIGLIGIAVLIGKLIIFKDHDKNNFQQPKIFEDKIFSDKCSLVNAFFFNKSQKIAAAEYLAHEIAYADLKEGQIIPIREKDEQITYAIVKKTINKNGFVAFLLAPMQEKNYLNNFPVWELFRGTQDKKSIRRLAEPYSPGHSSYKLHEKELLEAKVGVVPTGAKAITEMKFGHSLGGTDAQRSMASTADKIAILMAAKIPSLVSKNDKKHFIDEVDLEKLSDYLKKVRRIEAYVWNSPGVANTTNDSFKNSLAEINKSAKTNDQKCEFLIVENKVSGDMIQRTGETTLGHGISQNVSNIFREVYQFQYGYEGVKGFITKGGLIAKAKAHGKKNFNRKTNGGKDPAFTYANSQTNYAAVEQATGDHLKSGESWQKIKWFVSSKLIGSSIRDTYRSYSPYDL